MWDHGVLIQVRLPYGDAALAGLAGGAALLLAFMALAKVAKSDIWWVPNRLGSVLLGHTVAGPRGTAVGLAAHFAASAGFGALYALVVNRLTHELWMTGIMYAWTLWLVNFWGGQLSPAGRKMMQKKPAWLSPIAHVAYGGFMALVAEAFVSGVI
jgi:hypothetical protein